MVEGNIEGAGVFTDVFQLPGVTINPGIADVIEPDRMIMAARPGLIRKLLPLRVDETGVHCGGAYLFDTYENARAFARWVERDFRIDDVLFFDRFMVMEPSAQLWHSIGIEDFAAVDEAQHVMRVERWHLGEPPTEQQLHDEYWPRVRRVALEAGLSAVWLLYAPHSHHPQLGVISVSRHDGELRASGETGVLRHEETYPSPGHDVAIELHGTQVFDRTSWVYSVWYPVTHHDTDPSSSVLYPLSPPMPAPTNPPT